MNCKFPRLSARHDLRTGGANARTQNPRADDRERDSLRRKLSEIGNFLPATQQELRRKCGKPNCRCATDRVAWHVNWAIPNGHRQAGEEKLPVLEKRF